MPSVEGVLHLNSSSGSRYCCLVVGPWLGCFLSSGLDFPIWRIRRLVLMSARALLVLLCLLSGLSASWCPSLCCTALPGLPGPWGGSPRHRWVHRDSVSVNRYVDFPFVPVTFLEVLGHGTALFHLTFVSQATGSFHAHPFQKIYNLCAHR